MASTAAAIMCSESGEWRGEAALVGGQEAGAVSVTAEGCRGLVDVESYGQGILHRGRRDRDDEDVLDSDLTPGMLAPAEEIRWSAGERPQTRPAMAAK